MQGSRTITTDETVITPNRDSPAGYILRRSQLFSWFCELQTPRSRKAAAGALLAALLAYVVAASYYRSTRKLLWFDEVCTAIVVGQQSFPGIWNALVHAIDTQPPGFYV